MTLTLKEEHALAAFLVLMLIIPFGLIILLNTEVPYTVVSGEPVKEALTSAGVTVTSVKESTWNLTGATGGRTYVLTDREGNTVTIATQSFADADARDAAIRLYNSHPVGRGRPVGSLVVIGSQLVYVTPANSDVLKEIGPALRSRLT